MSQQAAEKALKALHYGRGARFVFGHSLVELLNALVTDYPALSGLRDGAQQLDQYYIPTRYPNSLPGGIPAEVFTGKQAADALGYAQEFIAHVKAEIGD